MSNEINLKNASLEELKETGYYDNYVIDALILGDFSVLGSLSSSDKGDDNYMEPLLKAVKREKGTYIVFKHCTGKLLTDMNLASLIVESEPELIEGTPLSRDKDFIMNNISKNPVLYNYISFDLKKDFEVIQKVVNTNEKEVIEKIISINSIAIILAEKPELVSDYNFMVEAVEVSTEALSFASKELKSDVNFLREVYAKNKEALSYTAEHTEEFGTEGLKVAKELIIENSSTDAISDFEVEQKKVAEQLQSEETRTEEEEKDLKIKERQLKNHIRFIERIKNGEIDPVRAAKLMRSLCKNMDPEYRKQLEDMLKIDETVVEREETQQLATNNNFEDGKLTWDDIKETVIPQATIEGVKKVAKKIEHTKQDIANENVEKSEVSIHAVENVKKEDKEK